MENFTKDTYFRLTVGCLTREEEESFSEFCFAEGAQGICEKLDFEQTDFIYDPEPKLSSVIACEVYFSAAPEVSFFQKLKSAFPKVQVELEEKAQQDWMTEWKKGFKSFLFADPFWIVPSWLEAPPQARQVIRIDPGMAFGTGTHETTQLAARLMLRAYKQKIFKSLLDVGTGTGLLAMLGSRLGSLKVVAIDNDPECLRVAHENLEQNQMSEKVLVPSTQLHAINDNFELVVANIIDGVLLKLKPDLLRALSIEGCLIVSGILQSRESAFLADFCADADLRLIERASLGEWVGLWFERKRANA